MAGGPSTFNPNGIADTAITIYKWHSTLNRPVSVRTRTAGSHYLVDSISYDTDSTMLFQQRGTGNAPTRVNFTYTSDKLPLAVSLPLSGGTTLGYDSLGNVVTQTSALGYISLTKRDALGRPDTVFSPRVADSSSTEAKLRASGVRNIAKYDAMGRDTLNVTIGPRVKLPSGRVVPVDTIRVRKTYDVEGRPLVHRRLYSRNTDTTGGALYTMNDSEWQYDSLGRVWRKKEAGSGDWTTFTLDPAGNVTNTNTPRGKNITGIYDAANRLSRRIVPQVTYDSTPCVFYWNSYPDPPCHIWYPTAERATALAALCISVDTTNFRYDAVGNLVRAQNKWSVVARSYTPTGAISSETQASEPYGTNSSACGGGDRAKKSSAGELSGGWTVGYTYDLAGRRATMTLPTDLDPCSGACVQKYKYDTTTGALATLVHPKANGDTLVTTFSYDAQGRLAGTTHPGSASTTYTYDYDGRLITRSGPLTDDELEYDAAGRITGGESMPPSWGGALAINLRYNGLGAVQWVQGLTPDMTAEDIHTDALGNKLRYREKDIVENVDRTRVNVYDLATSHLTGVELGTSACADSLNPGNFYLSSCHPQWYAYLMEQDYDASGNVISNYEFDTPTQGNWSLQESRSYYAADEKLTYFNRMSGLLLTEGSGTGVFEEYRYDAFGRRVLMRSRRVGGSCGSPCEAFVERTIYDGDQVLIEARTYGAVGADSSYFEQTASIPFYTSGGGDLFGIVVYAHGAGIDQPVHVLKKTPPSYIGNGGWSSLTPFTDWRGEYAYGRYPGGTDCTSPLAPICPSFPGYNVTASGGPPTAGDPPTNSIWVGNLLRGRRDASGLTYLRNRYYDANTGRFTQLDPIGLAGGLNLYGFAGGDPVNFSDPFGLCPPCDGNGNGLSGEDAAEVFRLLSSFSRSLLRSDLRVVGQSPARAGVAIEVSASVRLDGGMSACTQAVTTTRTAPTARIEARLEVSPEPRDGTATATVSQRIAGGPAPGTSVSGSQTIALDSTGGSRTTRVGVGVSAGPPASPTNLSSPVPGTRRCASTGGYPP